MDMRPSVLAEWWRQVGSTQLTVYLQLRNALNPKKRIEDPAPCVPVLFSLTARRYVGPSGVELNLGPATRPPSRFDEQQ